MGCRVIEVEYLHFSSGFFYSTGSTLNKAFRSLSFLLFFFFQNASPHSPSQLNEKHCWPLIFHGSITIFNFVDKCAIVKPSKVSPTLGLCVLLCVCVHACILYLCVQGLVSLWKGREYVYIKAHGYLQRAIYVTTILLTQHKHAYMWFYIQCVGSNLCNLYK